MDESINECTMMQAHLDMCTNIVKNVRYVSLSVEKCKAFRIYVWHCMYMWNNMCHLLFGYYMIYKYIYILYITYYIICYKYIWDKMHMWDVSPKYFESFCKYVWISPKSHTLSPTVWRSLAMPKGRVANPMPHVGDKRSLGANCNEILQFISGMILFVYMCWCVCLHV